MTDLTTKQMKAAILLVSGTTSRETACAIQCTPETISHWKKNPKFEALLNQLRWELLETGREQLRAGVQDAVTALRELVKDTKNPEVRRKTAIDLLRMNGLDGDPQNMGALYGWGIGNTTPEEIAEKEKLDARIAAILGNVSGN